MTHTVIQRILSIFLLTCMAVVSLLGQDYKTMIGKWTMTSETNGDPVTWTLVLKEQDGKLTAFLATDEAEQPAKDFTYADGVLKFKAPYQGEDYDIELKAIGGKLDGTWTGGGDSGKTSGTKI
jgi:hypothetical protein